MFCEDCGNKLPDNAKFCDACGARMDTPVYQAPLEEDAWPPPSPQQPPYASSQQTAAPRQTYAPQAKRPKLWLIIAIAVATLAGLCVGAYFLFFAAKPLLVQTAAKPTAGVAAITTEPTPVPSAVDFAATRNVSDLAGVWEGYFLYTAIGYDGMQTDGILYVGDTQLIKIKITGESLEANRNWNEVILRLAEKGEADRKRRGEAFMPECGDMNELLYDACMVEDNIFDYPVHVWGFPHGMSEQTESGTIVIGHFADDSYPVCLLYRYNVGEPKITGDDWISAWGVVTGLFKYTDANGKKAICPRVEVICWNNE